ncbi:MAG: beta-N-acetylhexosaminidase [Clostridiales bacterium]|jgi:beta-N-acetylhexosaminidase|nr:beta-N-acetylhexosaminidase [Clostridiales bacterium]
MKLSEMTLEQKVGQVICAGYPGPAADEGIKSLIRDRHLGNIILFQRNFEDCGQLYDTIKELQEEAAKSNGIPLFVGIDQEGGYVTRLWNGATVFPGAMACAATGNPEYAKLIGSSMGAELKALGININFAPVLDINTNPDNPVINTRSYGDDKETVAAFGAACCEGLQKHVLAAAKHFPGHGDTHQDTHLTLPTMDFPKERLDSVELYPFIKLVESGVKAIMTSHVIYPAYDDSGVPATLSEPILTGILRNRLGFEGIIITDCMEMNAIKDFYGTVEASKKALAAGADIVLICHTKERQAEAIEALKQAVMEDPALMKKLDAAVERILRYKAELPETPSKEEMAERFELGIHRTYSESVAQKSITLYRGVLEPFGADEAMNAVFFNTSTGLTGVENRSTRGRGDLEGSFKAAFKQANMLSMPADPGAELTNKLMGNLQKDARTVIFSFNASTFPGQAEAINRILEAQPGALVVAMRSPYDIHRFEQVKNYVLAYDYTPPAIDAVVAALQGQFEPSGKSPVGLEPR